MSTAAEEQPVQTESPKSCAVPGARLALILLLSINLFNYIDRQVLAAVLPAVESEFFPKDPVTGLAPPGTKENLGLLATAFMLSYLLISPLFGWLGDRCSPWLLVGVGVMAWSVASGASGLAASYALLLATRCCVGVGEAAYGPIAPTLISDYYPVKMRGYVLSWFYMAIPVGLALGYVLGGAVLKLTGNWRLAFYLVVPPGLLLGVLSFLMPAPRRGQTDAPEQAIGPTARLADYLILLRTPSYVLDTLGMTAMTFALGGIGFWMPHYIVHDRGYGEPGEIAMIFGGITVVTGLGATILGGLLGDWLRPRYSGSYFLVSGIVMLLAFPPVLLVLWTPFPLAWLWIFVACFCLFFNTGPTNTILANVSHPAIRATAFAVNIFIIHAFGDAVSPWIIGRIASRSDMDRAFAVVSLLILVGGLLWLFGARHLARDTELAATRLEHRE